MEYLELGLISLGLVATVYFSREPVGLALRTSIGRWALAVLVLGLGVALASGYVIDLAHAGVRPERLDTAQLVMMMGLLVFALGLLGFFARMVHLSYGVEASPFQAGQPVKDPPALPAADALHTLDLRVPSRPADPAGAVRVDQRTPVA